MRTEDQTLPKGAVRVAPNVDTKLLAKMQGAFSFNLTHASNLLKALPGTTIYNELKDAQGEHKNYCRKLEQDATKTDGLKLRMALASANKAYVSIAGIVDKDMAAAQHVQNKLLKKVDKAMEVKGTTDALLRMQYGSIVQDMTFSEIMTGIQQGDLEIARALELPIIAGKFNLKSDPKRAETLKTITQQVVLGKDFGELGLAKTAVGMFTNMGDDFITHIESNVKAIDKIDSTVVSAPEGEW